MSRAYDIERTVAALEQARAAAVAAGLDEHFVSEVDHLIATARANGDEEKPNE